MDQQNLYLEHGQHQMYADGCRCSKCRAFASDRTLRNRFSTQQLRSPKKLRAHETITGLLVEHGTYIGYQHYGCRCAPCTEANTVYMRDYRARRKVGDVTPAKGSTRVLSVRKRRNIGDRHPRAQLTAEQVVRIKQLIALDVDTPTLAKMFGVSDNTIYSIRKGGTWKHVE